MEENNWGQDNDFGQEQANTGWQGSNYQQYSQYQKPGMGSSGNGFGIASMILGILSLVLFCTCINIPIAVTAIVFGILHLGRHPESKAFGIAGISTGALSIIAFIITIVLLWSPLEYYSRQMAIPYMPYAPGYRDGSGYDDGYDYDDDEYDFDDFFNMPFGD